MDVAILFTMYVVFVGRLVCSVNVLHMNLSYIGSLDQSTRASEHVTVQLVMPVKLRLVLLIVSSNKFCF